MKKYITLSLILCILLLSVPADALYRVTDFIGGCADCADVIDGARFNAKTKPVYLIVTTTPEHATYPSKEFVYLWDSDAACSEVVPDSIIPDTNANGGCLMLLTPGQAADIVANSVNDTHIDWGTGADQVSAVDVPIADSGSIITGTEVETALQENRGAINTNTGLAHAESHAVASHSDTSGTGAELDTLTDTSDASGLHNHTTGNLNDTTATGTELTELTDGSVTTEHDHSRLAASDGTPNNVIDCDANGGCTASGDVTVNGVNSGLWIAVTGDDTAGDAGDISLLVDLGTKDAGTSAAIPPTYNLPSLSHGTAGIFRTIRYGEDWGGTGSFTGISVQAHRSEETDAVSQFEFGVLGLFLHDGTTGCTTNCGDIEGANTEMAGVGGKVQITNLNDGIKDEVSGIVVQCFPNVVEYFTIGAEASTLQTGDKFQVSANGCAATPGVDGLVAGTDYFACMLGSSGNQGPQGVVSFISESDARSAQSSDGQDCDATTGANAVDLTGTGVSFNIQKYIVDRHATPVKSELILGANLADYVLKKASMFFANPVSITTGSVGKLFGLDIPDLSAGDKSYGTMLWNGADCHWMDGTTGVALCSETITLTAAEIKALATSMSIVDARGADTFLEFISAVMVYDYDTVFAEPSTPEDLIFEYGNGTDITNDIVAAGFIDQANDEIRYVLPDDMTTNLDITALVNQNIELFNLSNNYTGGTGNSEAVTTIEDVGDILIKTAHGFNNGDPVTIASTECGITAGTVYWVCGDDGENRFRLDETQGCGMNEDCSLCDSPLNLTACSPAQAITAQSVLNIKVNYRAHVLGL